MTCLYLFVYKYNKYSTRLYSTVRYCQVDEVHLKVQKCIACSTQATGALPCPGCMPSMHLMNT